MGVNRREYIHPETRKPAWGYAFVHEKVRYRQAGYPTREEAQEAEDRRRKEVVFDALRVIPAEKLLFTEAVVKFLAYRDATRAPGTVGNERRRFAVLSRAFGAKRLTSVSTADIQRYVQSRAGGGKANRTINLELTALRSLFRYAMENGFAAESPAKAVKNLRETKTEKWIPSREQFEAFVKAAHAEAGMQLLVWLMLRAFTGVRPSESFHIEWDDCCFERNQITIRPKNGHGLKSGRFRVVDIHPALRRLLLEWREEWNRFFKERAAKRAEEGLSPEAPHQWVFFHPRQPYRRAGGFRKSFVKARDAAGIPRLTSHGLRHYFISHAVMDGVDLLTIAKWVGHSGTKLIEDTYGHLSPAYRASQMAKLKIADIPSLT